MAQDIERKAEARWHGSLKEGSGKLSLGSGTLKDTPYTWASRFGTDKGMNPEELLGAAHAACYAMFLSALLSQKEYSIHHVNVEATVYLNASAPPTITHIKLTVRAKVDDLEADMFQTQAEEAKRGCPLSKALASVPIELEAILE
ncbi:MAG: OsmC family peroxiredoxin [Aggregatilineales bacterium]